MTKCTGSGEGTLLKPRLDPVPLTPEDRVILRRLKLGLPFHHLWQGADRRDADLMLEAANTELANDD